MLRIVLDTDVVVAAMRSATGASAAIIRALDHGGATLLLSVPLALEYEAICRLAEHRLAAGLDMEEVDVFINGLVALAKPIETYFVWRPQLRDPGDEMVLETAVNGNADLLVTFNRRDYGAAPNSFGVQLLTPGEAPRRIST